MRIGRRSGVQTIRCHPSGQARGQAVVESSRADAARVCRRHPPAQRSIVNAMAEDPIIQRIESFRCRRGQLFAERRNRGYTLNRANSGALVARLRPTGQDDRVEVLYWSLWKNVGPRLAHSGAPHCPSTKPSSSSPQRTSFGLSNSGAPSPKMRKVELSRVLFGVIQHHPETRRKVPPCLCRRSSAVTEAEVEIGGGFLRQLDGDALIGHRRPRAAAALR
jgi:hypothetical protein